MPIRLDRDPSGHPAWPGVEWRHGKSSVEFREADAFELLAEYASARRSFDMVVLDPPAFAKSRGNVQDAARAVPTDSDALAVHAPLQNVRQFVAQLSGAKIVLMMAFFEGWITRFMSYLATLAQRQGSAEHEYTDVHGVVDVVHTRELLRALDAELTLLPTPQPPVTHLLEGVHVLRTLIQSIIHPVPGRPVSA